LHGLAQAFRDRTGESWQAPEAGYRSDSIYKVRGILGEEHFERAYGQGRALSLDQGLDLALGTAAGA